MKPVRSALGLAGLLVILALLAGSCTFWNPLAGAGFGDLKIYWLTGHRVYSSNLDGSDQQLLYDDTSAPNYQAIAVDPVNQKIYWSDNMSIRMYRADLDGSNREIFLNNSAVAIAVDPYDEKVYFVPGGMDIVRVNLDGSGYETVYPGGGSITDLKLDLVNGYVYWADGGTIYRRPIGGSLSANPVVGTGNAVAFIDLDVVGGMIYYVDSMTSEIRRAPSEGGVSSFVVDVGAVPANGFALDAQGGKVYWSVGTGAIGMRIDRANSDGTGGIETVVDDTSTSTDAQRIALYLWP